MSYFINQNLDKDFYRMRPDGSETTPFQLANMDQILAWPSDWLLATTYNRGVVALYRVHPFEGHIQYLIGDIRDDTFKALAQDGTWLIFESQNRLYRLSLHDAQVSPLLPESAVHHFQGASSEWVVFTGDDQLYRISLHTGQMEFLQDMSGCAFLDFLATSPDNQTMIFWCGYDRLHRLDLVTGRIDLVAKNLPDSGTLYFYNAWSPDSRWVIFSAFKDEVRILYLLDMSTGIFRRLTDSYRSETFITWTPDGEWAILSEYLTRGQTQFSLIRSRPDGSDAQVLSNKPTYFTGWSPPFESDYAGFMPLIRRIFVMCCRRTASALLQRVKSDLPKQCVDQAANGHLSHGQ